MLDEADQLLSLGFKKELAALLAALDLSASAWFTSRGKMGRTPMGRWATSRPP